MEFVIGPSIGLIMDKMSFASPVILVAQVVLTCLNYCTVCSDTNKLSSDLNGSYCYCKDSYYEVGFSQCAPCSSLCFNCLTTASNCTACDPNLFRVLSGYNCICATRFGTQQLSYYDNLLDPE
ncbi:hypothetical protein pb186bvf_019868 [Paramecium bursaria]